MKNLLIPMTETLNEPDDSLRKGSLSYSTQYFRNGYKLRKGKSVLDKIVQNQRQLLPLPSFYCCSLFSTSQPQILRE